MHRKTHKGQQIRKCEALSATYAVNEGYQAVPCAMLVFWIFFHLKAMVILNGGLA